MGSSASRRGRLDARRVERGRGRGPRRRRLRRRAEAHGDRERSAVRASPRSWSGGHTGRCGRAAGRKSSASDTPVAVVVAKGVKAAFDLVVIGASTGGPQAVSRGARRRCPPTSRYRSRSSSTCRRATRASYAERIDRDCALDVFEAREELELTPGRVAIARAGMHLTLADPGRLVPDAPRSVAARHPPQALGRRAVRERGEGRAPCPRRGAHRHGGRRPRGVPRHPCERRLRASRKPRRHASSTGCPAPWRRTAWRTRSCRSSEWQRQSPPPSLEPEASAWSERARCRRLTPSDRRPRRGLGRPLPSGLRRSGHWLAVDARSAPAPRYSGLRSTSTRRRPRRGPGSVAGEAVARPAEAAGRAAR